jgi:hypothetical protein
VYFWLLSTAQLAALVARSTTLIEALRLIAVNTGSAEGVLRIISSKMSGRIAVSQGFVKGAILTGSGIEAKAALTELVKVKTGVFQFVEIEPEKSQLHQQNLRIKLEAVINNIGTPPVAIHSPLHDTVMDQIVQASSGINAERIKMLDALRMIELEVDRQAFFDENPALREYENPNALTQDQINVLRLYASLSTDEDKRFFLEAKPEFAWLAVESSPLSAAHKEQLRRARFTDFDLGIQKFMQESGWDASNLTPEQQTYLRNRYEEFGIEGQRITFMESHPEFAEFMKTGLSVAQKADLFHGKFASLEGDMDAFQAFQEQILGPDHPPLSNEQLEMLRDMFIELATEANRQNFLIENPVLSSDLPVLRGDDVLPFLPQAEPEIVIDEAVERTRRLDALKVKGLDYAEFEAEEVEVDKFVGAKVRRMVSRGQQREKILVAVSWAAVFAIFGSVAFLVFTMLNRSDAPPIYLDESELTLKDNEEILNATPAIVAIERQTAGIASAGGSSGVPSATPAEDQIQYFDAKPKQDLDIINPQVASIKEKADIALASGSLDEAIKGYEECMGLDAKCSSVRLVLVRALIAKRRLEDAKRQCTIGMSMTKDPSEIEAFKLLLDAINANQV